MNRILTTLIAAGLATTAMAQTPAPTPAKDPKDKQEMVKSATEATAKSKGVISAEGSAAAAADKTPKKPRPKMSEHEKELRKAATP